MALNPTGLRFVVRAGAIDVSDATATFGALTLSGAGGYQIVSSTGAAVTNTIATGGNATGYTLTTGGLITPSSDAGLSAQNGKTIAVATDQGSATITLSVEASTYSVRNAAEFEALDGIAAATLAGKTIKLRRRATADLQTAWSGARFRFREMATPLTVTGEDTLTPVWELQFTECSNVVVTNLAFVAQWQTLGDENKPMLQFSGNAAGTWNNNITVHGCLFQSGYQDPAGANAWKQMRGCRITVQAGGTGETIRVYNNTFTDVFTGLSIVGGTDIDLYDNIFDSIFADCCSTSVLQSTWNVTVRDNFFGEQRGVVRRDYSAGGGPSYDVHAGKIEFNFTGWAANASGIRVLRNVSSNTDAYYSGNTISVKDLGSPYYVTGVEVSGNIFQQFNSGIRLERCNGAIVRYNTVPTNLNDLSGDPSIVLAGCINSTVQFNACRAFGDDGSNTLSANYTLTETASAYNAAFAGNFTGNTMPARTKAATIAGYAPDVGGPLDPATSVDRIGAGWFDDYNAKSSSYPA